MGIPFSLHRYFWNCRVDELDTEKHKFAIIEQLLEYGDLDAMRWLVQNYTSEEIVPVLRRTRCVSPQHKSFWAVFFHIDLPEAHVRQGTPWWDRSGAPEAR